ncbi:MAG: hypothetical protein SGILL_008764, partial [Bacillariaceae sp.]
SSVEENPKATKLKEELLSLADRTNRGFQASQQERTKIKDIVYELASSNPSKNPARGYYESSSTSTSTRTHSSSYDVESNDDVTISGKWTLIYTDAPDITSLDTSRNPFATAKLGRIGQECNPPFIKNVIEWRRPDWASNLPLSGTDSSKILQKVVTSASATSSKPLLVDLKVAGLELESGESDSVATASDGINDLVQRVEEQGLPAGILSAMPVDLKGPLNPPFGQFEILYVDEDIRAIRTSQNYLAVNQRIQRVEDEWF